MKLQLQSILLPGKETCDVEELYFHRGNMEDRSEILFDGYFNLYYIEKRKAYTVIDNLSMELTMQGFDELTLMHDETPVGTIELDADEWKEYFIDLPYMEYDKGVFWFKLRVSENKERYPDEKPSGKKHDASVSGYYITDIAEDKFRPVNIGIDICTYKREEYIIRNLNQLKTELFFNTDLDASLHYIIYLVDNGRSLQNFPEITELKEIYGGKLKVIPNKNSGGTGGFTRGMIEILNDKEKLGLTHVLIMDDDATYEPDSFVRLYGFLATLNDRWKDITVGGAMYRDDLRYILYCAGEYWEHGYIYSQNMNTDLREFSNASKPLLTETGHEYEWYSGWWLCCYSLDIVRDDNLPIPFFLHHDDIEFGMRNRNAGIVFLNGIGVWHRIPNKIYPGSSLYYDVRNNLIEIALNEKGSRKIWTAGWILFRAYTVSTIRLRYKEVQLQYQGFLDFLKGPQWLYRQDPEKLNARIRSEAIEMEPLDDVMAALSGKDKKAAIRQLEEYDKENEQEAFLSETSTKRSRKLLYWLTFNGWILPADKKEIKLVASTQSPYKGFRKQRILMYEPGTGKATVGFRDKAEMKKVLNIYRKTFILLIRYFKKACYTWQENVGKITNKTAWEKYLE